MAVSNSIFIEDGYVMVIVKGIQTEETVWPITDAAKHLYDDVKKSSSIILDLTGVTGQDLSARKSAREFLHLPYKKIAIYGAKPYLYTVVGLIIKGSRALKKVQMFKTKEEALNWIKQ